MSRWKQIGLARSSLSIILGGIVLLVAIVLLGILPAKQEALGLKAEAGRLESRIEEQRILFPLYAGLVRELEQKTEIETILEEMDRETDPLTVDNSARVLIDMALKAGMDEAYFTPVPGSLARDSSLMLVEGNLRGEYQSLREFVLSLSSWENFNHLELLEVQSRQGGHSYKVTVWMIIG